MRRRKEKIFLDTGVLVYAYDRSAGKKREIARRILEELWQNGMGVVSAPVLMEFFTAVTSFVPRPLSRAKALEILQDFMTWEVVYPDPNDLREALNLATKRNLSLWDAMVLVCALKAEASLLYSENFSPRLSLPRLAIRNPFQGVGGVEVGG